MIRTYICKGEGGRKKSTSSPKKEMKMRYRVVTELINTSNVVYDVRGY